MVVAIGIRAVDISISIIIDAVVAVLAERADTERVGDAVDIIAVNISVKIVISIVITDLGESILTEGAVGAFGIGAVGLSVPIIIDSIAAVLRHILRIPFHPEASIGGGRLGSRTGRSIVLKVTSSLPWISPPSFRESVNETPLLIGIRSVKVNSRSGAPCQPVGITPPLKMRPQFPGSIAEIAQGDQLGITLGPERVLWRPPEGNQHNIIDSAIGLPRNGPHRINLPGPHPPGAQGVAVERADRLEGPTLIVCHEMGKKYIAPVSDDRDERWSYTLGGE
jgi:hypothetical protein